MNDRDDEMYQAASMYYVQGETMDAIARILGVSRSTVSRLLRDARDSGLVQITLNKPTRSTHSVSQQISRMFGVACHVVPVREGTSDLVRLDKVSRVAAGLVSDAVQPHGSLGLAWGTTVAAVVEQLPRREVPGLTVVQLNGSASAHSTGGPFVGSLLQHAADAYGGSVLDFPAPAFFDRVETRELMWQERSIRRVLQVQREVDVAFFGVGTFTGPMRSHVYAAGYLDQQELDDLRNTSVVGDVCTVMLREDGTYADIPLNRRASGLTPGEMAGISRRICVAAGRARVAPLLGALRARAATDLVIDDDTAVALVEHVGVAPAHGAR